MNCMIEGCNRIAKTRGLCIGCYQAARNKVRRGAVEWETLERLGMSAEPANRGRSEGSFEKMFKAKVTDNEVHV